MRAAALLLSVGLHICVLVLVLYSLPHAKAPEAVPVEVLISQSVPKDLRITGRVAKSRAMPSIKAPGQTGLFPKFSAAASFRKSSAGTFSDSRNYDTGIEEIFGADGNKNWSFHREIYSRIDSELLFDSLLAQYSHFGRVQVQFTVTQNGILKMDGLIAKAEDAILKVHVLRAISRSLREPLNQTKYSKMQSDVVFQAQFDFSFGENFNYNKQKNYGKPVFVFKRSTAEKPVPEDMLDHLLAGGVTPNVSLMHERWKKFNKKKHLRAVQFDPFASYRRDPFYLL